MKTKALIMTHLFVINGIGNSGRKKTKLKIWRKSIAFGIILMFVGISSFSISSGGLPRDDTTPPVTTATLNPPETNGDNGWYTCDVWVTLNATDNESGVNATYYRIDDGVWQLYTGPFPLFNDGIHHIGYYSDDNMGNIEPMQSVQCNIDQTAPTVNLTIKLRWDMFPKLFIANCNDETSGMDRVEFHSLCFGPLIDYEEPFEYPIDAIPSDEFDIIVDAVAFDKAGNHNCDEATYPIIPTPSLAQGFIINPTFSDHTVTFFALFVLTNPYGLVIFRQVTFTYNESYYGYIGRFFIRAVFI